MSKVKLKEITNKIGSGATPKGGKNSYQNEGIALIRSQNVLDFVFSKNGLAFINEEQAKELDNVIVNKKDILLNITGDSIARVCMVPDKILPARVNQHVSIIRCNDDAVPHYVMYYLLYLKPYLLKICGVGGTRNALTKDVIEKLKIEKPKFDYQQKIASVLSSLDAKIELNNRINTELEAMSKMLYDYWFVQFNFPDKNGKPYKSSGGKMVWNAELKREIPEGWRVECIEQCCSIIDCLHSKKSELIYEDEHYYLLQLDNIKDDGLIDLTSKYYVTKIEYKNWTSRIEVSKDDILITNAGRVAATAQVPDGIVAGIGRNITAIRPNSIKPTYLFLAFRSLDMKRQIRWNTDSGAFFSSLNVKGIKKLFIARPPDAIEGNFEKIVNPIRRKRELNNIENQILFSLRDWLLPMLMNGQVKVN